MQLSSLLSQLRINDAGTYETVLFEGIAQDSRHVKPGDLFIAYQGIKQDGKDYIAMAIQAGAVAILSDQPVAEPVSVPVIVIPNLSLRVSEIAAHFYHYPAEQLSMVGITGTNGKTSIASFIKQAMEEMGYPVASIGTLGVDFIFRFYTAMTTPSEITLQESLDELLEQGCQWVAMEVSSHALDQNRVGDINWRYAIFSNFSLDHLDYHGTLEHYQQSKQKLFSQLSSGSVAIVNIDDPVGQSMLDSVQPGVITFGYGSDEKSLSQCDKFIKLCSHEQRSHTQQMHCESSWGKLSLTTQLLGTYNLYNLLPVVMLLAHEGHALSRIEHVISTIIAPSGRLERFQKANLPTAWVDFAHTPDALSNALMTLKEACPGRLWVVFGCGGQRDKGKRPLMAKAVEQYADNIILTQDNSRQEPVAQIFADTIQGFSDTANYQTIEDRKLAIDYALEHADAQDWVLVAGRGAEPFLELADSTTAFCDINYIKTRYQLDKTQTHVLE